MLILSQIWLYLSSFWQSKSLTPIDPSDFKLPPKLAEKAKQNFGETDEIRRQSIDLLRDWAEKNPRIEKIRLDTNSLLIPLRLKKFSVPMAQELIEREIIQKECEFNERKIFKNVDLKNNEKIQNLLNRGWASLLINFFKIFVQDCIIVWKFFRYSVILPKQNLSENFVFLIRVNVLDPSKDEFHDIARTLLLTMCYTVLPEVMIMKHQFVYDFKGFSSNHLKYLPDMIRFMKILKPFQVSIQCFLIIYI